MASPHNIHSYEYSKLRKAEEDPCYLQNQRQRRDLISTLENPQELQVSPYIAHWSDRRISRKPQLLSFTK